MCLSPPKVPCGSCPYRKDVPSGIWDASEYEKLPLYDRETPEQPFGVFMCHQRDGCLCGGWLMAHDRFHLLSLRLAGKNLDPSVWDYAPDVEVFSSGLEAAIHGMKDIKNPSDEAQRKINGLTKLMAKRS
jgi:hypothetical protein